MAAQAHTTPARLNPTWVPAEQPLGLLAPFFNRRGQAPAAANDPKPEGDPWAALLASVQPWPRVQAHAFRRRSQGWSVADFCDERVEALTALAAEREFA